VKIINWGIVAEETTLSAAFYVYTVLDLYESCTNIQKDSCVFVQNALFKKTSKKIKKTA